MKKDIEEKGVAYAYDLLKSKDPFYASKISSGDIHKIIRALEIIYLTNMTVTEAHLTLHRHPAYQYNIYLISKDRKSLYELIDRRVKKMFDMGWIDEVTHLLNMGYTETLSSFKAIGYREIASYIKNGGSLDDLIADIQKKTRHFAKRQATWFGHMKDLKYLDTEKLDIKRFAEKLAEQLNTV
jgi:tRNA dimethylallyltransferase